MGGLTSGEGGGLIQNSIFASRFMGLYARAYKGGGEDGIYTFCEHFESTNMVAALRSYSTKRGISLHSLSVSMCGLHTCQ